MNVQIKSASLFLAMGALTALGSFSIPTLASGVSDHATLSRTIETNSEGQEVVRTQILLNRKTSRETLIAACISLGKEQVQLTFDSLVIRKSFLGLLGKPRITYAKGQIQLPNGSTETFEAGGIFNFKSVKIAYSQVSHTDQYYINTIEIID